MRTDGQTLPSPLKHFILLFSTTMQTHFKPDNNAVIIFSHPIKNTNFY